MPIRPRGNYQVKRQRPRKRVSASGISYEIPLVGPYDVLEGQAPTVGSGFSGYPGEFLVEDYQLEHTGGGSGRMVVTIAARSPGNPTSPDDSALGDPVYESDYAEERRPIEEHKKCGKLAPDRPYYEYPDRKTSAANPAKTASQADSATDTVYKQRTWDHWQSLDAQDYDPAGGGWNLAKYKELKEKGRDDYPVNYPICSVTTYHRARPASGSGINTVSTPPSQCSPPNGYIYVKTTDRVTRQGRTFTRIQAWRGYDNPDELFFL